MPFPSDRALCRTGRWHLGTLVTMFLLALSHGALAEQATIQLTDGSTLRGELVSLKGGTYEFKTQSLGVIRVPQQDVALVSFQALPAGAATPANEASAGATAAGASSMPGLAQVQQQLMADPGSLAKIMALSDDALVQAVINDPAIQAAISRGDFTGLMQNPKIQALMAHPTIRQLSSQNK